MMPSARTENAATSSSGRRALLLLLGWVPCLVALSVSAHLLAVSTAAAAWTAVSACAALFVLTAALARQPPAASSTTVPSRPGRTLSAASSEQPPPLVPWLSAACVAACCVAVAQLVDAVWPAVTLWAVIGLLLLCRARRWCRRRAGRWSARSRERIRLHAPPRHSTVSTLVPSHQRLPRDSVRRITTVDTILISR